LFSCFTVYSFRSENQLIAQIQGFPNMAKGRRDASKENLAEKADASKLKT
jgi:hypothetical protein